MLFRIELTPKFSSCISVFEVLKLRKEFVCLVFLNILHCTIPLSSEGFSLLLDVRAQGNITGQLENKTCLMQFELFLVLVFFPSRRNKNPSVD